MKDPAFLFYPNDYLGGTMGMTFEEKGAYIELLMMQFNRGHMTEHMIGQTVGQLWLKLKDKFLQDDKGLWYNERLDTEKEKRKNFTQSRRNNLSGNNQYTKKSNSKKGHMTKHMENEDVNENINKDNNKSVAKNQNTEVVYPFDSEEFKNMWSTWKDYKKKEHKFKYASEASEQAALMQLNKLANGAEQTAIQIINQSLANGWKGFFALEINKNGKQKHIDHPQRQQLREVVKIIDRSDY